MKSIHEQDVKSLKTNSKNLILGIAKCTLSKAEYFKKKNEDTFNNSEKLCS